MGLRIELNRQVPCFLVFMSLKAIHRLILTFQLTDPYNFRKLRNIKNFFLPGIESKVDVVSVLHGPKILKEMEQSQGIWYLEFGRLISRYCVCRHTPIDLTISYAKYLKCVFHRTSLTSHSHLTMSAGRNFCD